LRIRLRRGKALKLKTPQTLARAYSEAEKENMLALAKNSSSRKSGSAAIYSALVLALNAGMRDTEIRTLAWAQVDFEKQFLTAGRSKTEACEGRTIPLSSVLLPALLDHSHWCEIRGHAAALRSASCRRRKSCDQRPDGGAADFWRWAS
jgi:integrase